MVVLDFVSFCLFLIPPLPLSALFSLAFFALGKPSSPRLKPIGMHCIFFSVFVEFPFRFVRCAWFLVFIVAYIFIRLGRHPFLWL